jgi:hypothetical protein
MGDARVPAHGIEAATCRLSTLAGLFNGIKGFSLGFRLDNLQRVYDTDSRIVVQQVDPVEGSFTLHSLSLISQEIFPNLFL